MRVRVLLFGVLRDGFGAGEQVLELPEGARAGELLQRLRAAADPALRELWPRLAVAVNREYAQADRILQPEDEVALLPPVSGGAPLPERVLLTRDPLCYRAAEALREGPDGALVLFDGVVRNNTRGRLTEYLVYEAYEAMALGQMEALRAEALLKFSVRDALLHHRLGRIEIGETSVLIAAASAHRGAAFDCCRWLIDTLKKTVPVWKKEHFVDGAVWADGEPFPPELQPDLAPGV